MSRTLNNHKPMKALALSFAAATIFTAAASAKPTSEPQVQSSPDSVLAEVPSDYAADWLVESPAGVTPTDLARPYEPQFVGVPQPDGYLSRHGDEPLITRDAPDGLLPQAPPGGGRDRLCRLGRLRPRRRRDRVRARARPRDRVRGGSRRRPRPDADGPVLEDGEGRGSERPASAGRTRSFPQVANPLARIRARENP